MLCANFREIGWKKNRDSPFNYQGMIYLKNYFYVKAVFYLEAYYLAENFESDTLWKTWVTNHQTQYQYT